MATPDSIAVAREIQRSTGMTFHLATRFLPTRVRHPTYVLYAYFRLADQVVDDPTPPPPARQRTLLDRYERAALGEIDGDHPVLAAMAELVDRHDIDESEITAFIDAMRADIEPSPYHTYADLEGYLRGSAVAVAYMMLAVMDPPKRQQARPHARALGEAFQLTNFLRDVREDILEYDRRYLPTATLDRYGVEPAAIEQLSFSPRVAAAIRHELERTNDRYREGVAGIQLLPPDCQFPVLLASVCYAEYHRMIANQRFDVLNKRPSFTRRRYLALTARTWLHWRLTHDPETVFYRISPVDPPADRPSAHRNSNRPDRLNATLYRIKDQLSSVNSD